MCSDTESKTMTDKAIRGLVQSFIDASVVAALMMKRLDADDFTAVIDKARELGIEPGRAKDAVQDVIDAGFIDADEVNAMNAKYADELSKV